MQTIDFSKFAVDEENRAITFSCASETPCERYDEKRDKVYDEVLVVDAVDLSRLNAGAPLLYNHDRDAAIGIVDRAWVEDGRLYVRARFTPNDAFAERMWKDTIEGLAKGVSIGYVVDQFDRRQVEGRETWYATKWMCYEVSLVTIPADVEVGFRSMQLKEDQMRKRSRREDAPEAEEKPEVKEEEVVQEEAKAEESEAVAHDEETKEAPVQGEETKEDPDQDEAKPAEETEEKPEDQPGEVEALKQEVEELKAKIASMEASCDEKREDPVDAPANGEEADEIRAAGEALGVPADEQERAIKSGMTSREFKLKFRSFNNIQHKENPMKFRDYLRAGDFAQKFTLTRDAYPGFGGQTGEGGASAIGTETKPLIAALEKVIGVKGYRTMSGLTSNISIPVQTGRNTIHQTEHLRDAATASAPVLTPVTLSPVKLSGNTRIGKELLVQSNDDIEAFIIDSLTKEIGYKVEDYLLGKVKAGAAGSVTYSALSAIDWDDVLAFEASIGGYALQTPAFVMSPAARAALKGIPKTENFPEFLCSGYNEINGYACNVSGVVGNDDLYFGDWSKLLLGVWGEGLEIMVNPYTYAKEGDVEIVASICIDAAVLQADAFVVGAVEESSDSSN